MKNKNVVIVTGGSNGIGLAIVKKFISSDNFVISADLKRENLINSKNYIFKNCDVQSEKSINELIDFVLKKFGRINYFFSNAGILNIGDEQSSDTNWEKNWKIHLMGHVYVARKLIPFFRLQKSGHLIITSSAAGLLTHLDSLTYSVTKHAAIAFAEWIAIHNLEFNINVSVVCPQAVKTNMTKGRDKDVAALDGMLDPDFVADKIEEGVKKKLFLILPHPEVLSYFQKKSQNYEKWLFGMKRLKDKLRMNKKC